MEIIHNMKRPLVLGLKIAIVAIVCIGTGCKKDDNTGTKTEYKVSGNATGAQEVPGVNTQGTGTIVGTYDKTDRSFVYTITWQALTGAPTAIHIHGPALAGETAPPLITVPSFTLGPIGTASDSLTLDVAQEADLLAGKWYYNIHTAANGNGEIRGQISAQ
jgi:hypothetical protein